MIHPLAEYVLVIGVKVRGFVILDASTVDTVPPRSGFTVEVKIELLFFEQRRYFVRY